MRFGVVLAGGQSRRMGTNKLYLESDGQTLLDRAVSVLHACTCDRIVISGPAGLEHPGTVQISDLDFPHAGGPPRGLYSVLEWIRQQYGLTGHQLLVIPADMPCLDLTILERLVEKGAQGDAVTFSGEVFPLLVRATESVHHFIRRGLEKEKPKGPDNARPGFSMKAILAGLDTLYLERKNADDRFFSNLNTPEDWTRYKNQKRQKNKKK